MTLPTPELTTTATVVHTMALLARPSLDAPARDIVWRDTVLVSSGVTAGFLQLTDRHGRHGYFPAAACLPHAVGSEDAPHHTQVVQPIMLYRQPQPGGQYVAAPDAPPAIWLVLPGDPLTLLGYEQSFVLIQRADGRVGYLPAQLCTNGRQSQARRSFDLGSALLGAAWFGSQAFVLSGLLAGLELTSPLELWYLRAMLVAALILLLWLASPRRVSARSFAVGIGSSYLLIELIRGLVWL
jgi:hypothetical protein